MPKKGSILTSFWKPEACGQTVLPDRSDLIGQKLVENAKIQMRHFGWFSNTVQKFSSSILKKTWENQLSFSCFALLRLIWKFRHKLDLRFSSMKICQTSSFSESSKSKAINWCIFEDSHQFLSKPRLLHNTKFSGPLT